MRWCCMMRGRVSQREEEEDVDSWALSYCGIASGCIVFMQERPSYGACRPGSLPNVEHVIVNIFLYSSF